MGCAMQIHKSINRNSQNLPEDTSRLGFFHFPGIHYKHIQEIHLVQMNSPESTFFFFFSEFASKKGFFKFKQEEIRLQVGFFSSCKLKQVQQVQFTTGIIGKNRKILAIYYLHCCSTFKHLSASTPQRRKETMSPAQRANLLLRKRGTVPSGQS